MKTIFNTYIEVKSQEQAYRLKQICIDNDLLILDDEEIWTYEKSKKAIFCSDSSFEFWLMQSPNNISKFTKIRTKVTESEWLELLKQHQCTK